jgi:hypothetical protein
MARYAVAAVVLAAPSFDELGEIGLTAETTGTR